MDLVVGATGTLGFEISLKLRRRGHEVRALVRKESPAERVAQLEAAGVQLSYGDLKDQDSLARACQGIESIVSTASSTQSRADGDSIETVDLQGQLRLVEAAQSARVRGFVFVSFPEAKIAFPLQSAKRSVEERLRSSTLRHTILQPPHFFETWFSAALGFDWQERRARLFGNGDAKLNFVSYKDVAEVAVRLIGQPAAQQKTFAFGGPDALSQRDMVAHFERLTGRAFAIETVPADALEQQARSGDSLGRSFAALMLLCGAREDYRIDRSALDGLVDLDWTTAQAFADATVTAASPLR
jgi:uncharacterized protein YbjT (DUF2867 family)